MPYLLPCACGNQIPVEPKDAGLTVVCSCGAQVKVPNTRSIYALPRVSEGGADETPTARWGVKNQLLTAGIICVLVAVFGIGYLVWTRPTSHAKWMAETGVHQMGIEQLMQVWQQLEEGFRPIATGRMEQYEYERDINTRWMWMTGVVGVGGVAMIAAALLMGKRS